MKIRVFIVFILCFLITQAGLQEKKEIIKQAQGFEELVPSLLAQMHTIIYIMPKISFNSGDLEFVDLPCFFEWSALSLAPNIKEYWKQAFIILLLSEPFFINKEIFVNASLRVIVQFLYSLVYVKESKNYCYESFEYVQQQMIYNWDALYSISSMLS